MCLRASIIEKGVVMKRAVFFSVLGAAVSTLLLGGAFAVASQTNFVLGSPSNAPDAISIVTAKPVGGDPNGLNDRMIQLVNNSTGANASALGLQVGSGRPPFTVNSSTKVTNLNADQLDNLDSSAFARAKPLKWTAVKGTSSGTVVPGTFRCLTGEDGNPYCWQNYGGGYTSAAFSKDPFGIVHLTGLVFCRVFSGGGFGPCVGKFSNLHLHEIFYLPTGYRPAAEEIFTSLSYTSATSPAQEILTRIDVRPDGAVTVPYEGDSYDYVSLDGLTFPAA